MNKVRYIIISIIWIVVLGASFIYYERFLSALDKTMIILGEIILFGVIGYLGYLIHKDNQI